MYNIILDDDKNKISYQYEFLFQSSLDIIYINVIRNNENVIRVPSVLIEKDNFKLISDDDKDAVDKPININKINITIIYIYVYFIFNPIISIIDKII